MKKPNLYKSCMFDFIYKSLDIALKNKEFIDYFERMGIEIIGIEGYGIKNDKKEGLILSFRDLNSEEVKHVEINPTVKTQLYESFTEYSDYEMLVKLYEQFTGNKMTSKAKNKVTQNFEELADNIKNKVGNINELAEEVFE